MANAGPNTNSSQFFITFEPQVRNTDIRTGLCMLIFVYLRIMQPHLDGKHVVFGEVSEGKHVLNF